MTTDTSVVYLDSTMSGAPALSGTAGTLIGVLDACLVNGFGSITLDSLVIVDNVATGTISTGHNLVMVGDTGPVILIEGASAPAAINGRFRIQTIPNATTFTFTTSGISNQTATGTITAKRAPAGFEKAFSATNKAAYRSLDIAGTQLFLRVDDGYGNYARFRGYETMSGVDTGAGPFPTDAQINGGLYVYKTNLAAVRPWTLYSDGRIVYLFCDSSGTGAWYGGLCFGDLLSYTAPDGYCALVIGSNSATSLFVFSAFSATAHHYLARARAQTGTSLAASKYSNSKTGSMGYQGETYVDGMDIVFWPVEVWDGTTNPRGLLPGVWNPLISNGPHGQPITDVPQLPGRTLITQRIGSLYSCAIDLTGPWR